MILERLVVKIIRALKRMSLQEKAEVRALLARKIIPFKPRR